MKDIQFFSYEGSWVFGNGTPDLDTFWKNKVANNVCKGRSSPILPCVTIGYNCVIGAGFVVTKSIDRGFMVVGNPARIIGKMEDFLEKIKKYSIGPKGMSYEENKAFLLSQPDENFLKK